MYHTLNVTHCRRILLVNFNCPFPRIQKSHLHLYIPICVDVSSFLPLPVTSSSTCPTVLSTNSLLVIPKYKKEVFKMLPQKNLHFCEVKENRPPEFREGQALGLMLSFANMAESIKNMKIQDGPHLYQEKMKGPHLYQEKMKGLLALEDNGFEVDALKVRLDNLLRIRNRLIDLREMKANLEEEVFNSQIANCKVEQQLKIIAMCMTGLEEELPQFQELVSQKHTNSSDILKLQFKVHQVEDSLTSAEVDFIKTAGAPWCLDPGSSVSTTISN